MDEEEIRYLLGSTIYQRARACVDAVREDSVETEELNNGGFHVTARVHGSGRNVYRVQLWQRKNLTLVSASCSCPYNAEGEGPYCKHIGALLLWAIQNEPGENETLAPGKVDAAAAIPGVMRGSELLEKQKMSRKDGYSAGLEMLFGQKWREAEPETDEKAKRLLKNYQERALAEVESSTEQQEKGFVELEPELDLSTMLRPMLRLRISGGGRSYIVKSIPALLRAVERESRVSYGKSLSFVHCRDAFSPKAQQILTLMQRNQELFSSVDIAVDSGLNSVWMGGIWLTGEFFDELIALCAEDGRVGGYELRKGLPELTLWVNKRRGGVQVGIKPTLRNYQGFTYSYFYDADTLWQVEWAEVARMMPAMDALCGDGLFFTTQDAVEFCSFVLPELGRKLTLDDPERLLLDQIPLEPVVQFYLDAPRMGAVTAHAEFLYGEERVTPQSAPAGLLRDPRAEKRAQRLLGSYLHPGEGGDAARYGTDDEEELIVFLEEGVPALLAGGEVYLSDAFRSLQAAPPRIVIGVSVQGSVLDLDVDTGEFPVSELRALLKSIRQKKRYHRLRDGRLLRVDHSLEILEELDETLELSGAKLDRGHAQLPLYRAPSLDWALSGQSGVQFNRDDAFRRISWSFHAVKDSEYAPPESLQKVLRKYQRDGYRWLRTLDSYGMGGILADDMGLGKTVQVLSYLLAIKQEKLRCPDGAEQTPLPSLIVCPASLVLNWAEECRKFTPELNCLVVDGTAARRAELAGQWSSADVVVTSYDLLRRDEELYADQAFYACILDEAQAIKNHTTQKYKAVCRVQSRVRFALTGTPVENRLSELWSIFSFLMPGYLPPYRGFCTRFEKPIVQENDQNAVRRLNQMTRPFILRRMKAEVLRELPPKTENIHRIEMEEMQRRLYLAAVVDARDKLRAAQPEDKMAVFAVLMRLREICCDPRLVTDDWEGGSAKLDACMDLILSAVEGGHRILLFSQFTSMLELLAKRLDEEKIRHFTLQGSTPKPVRAELVRRFNAGEADVFLISLRAGGTGLNLTAADIVIHYDPWWNVAAQNQATDRAYRIGQQNPVQVYKLIAQDTIEEKIVELQQAKQVLADTVAGTADGTILSMKPEELLELLEGEQ